jgi:hypothetical protein
VQHFPYSTFVKPLCALWAPSGWTRRFSRAGRVGMQGSTKPLGRTVTMAALTRLVRPARERPLTWERSQGLQAKGIAFHSVWIIPHFVQQNSRRSPAVRRAHGTVSIPLRSMVW